LKNNTLKYILILGFLFFLIACSVKKDRFVNRNFHAVTTEYNVLFNGYEALDAGVVDLVATYKDNFWEILPVERMPDVEENLLPGEAKNPNFKRAEDKAVKAIQKHSMNIAGNEKNPQMDEAYLLLGKARYYDNRFIPALEALNYILYKYPQSDKIYHAKVWREKVNIRLENNDVAIKNLKRLLDNNQIDGQDLADANAMLTQAYINTGSNDSAIATIKIAKEATKSKEERARYLFILGQLYESFAYNDSAFVAYQQVIDMNRKAPRRYVIHAHAKQAAQFDYNNGDTLAFSTKFNELIADRENRPFLDVLYHQKGLFYDKMNLDEQAKKYYNKSIKSFTNDGYLISSNYRNLGEIHFDNAEYKKAGMYYDSTLLRLNERTREYRQIKKKRDNLEEVIKYEEIAKANDSILSVVAMNDKARITYFENYIEKLKIQDAEKERLAKEKAEKEANILANTSPGGINPPTGGNILPGKILSQSADIVPLDKPQSGPKNANQSAFYFYNPVTVNYGKREFISKWGNRQLVENWRVAASTKNAFSAMDDNENDLDDTDDKEEIVENPLYSVDYYLTQIPTDTNVIDSLGIDRNLAYYQLGLIYKEKFKEYQLAANRFEQLLKNKPEEKLVLPTKYNLFKIYEIIDPSKAKMYKEQILNEYPDSRYAQIIQNPQLSVSDNESPDLVYNRLYKSLQENKVKEVFEEVTIRIEQYFGDEMLPKFEMLRAAAIGRLNGLDEYKAVLNWVAVNYPNKPEGKQAEIMLTKKIPAIEALQLGATEVSSWKLVFPKENLNEKDKKQLVEKLNLYLKDSQRRELKISDDLYTANKDFIVLHGFVDDGTAFSVLTLLREYKNYKVKDEVYIISAEDYKVIQMKKQFDDWKKLNKK
jgi:tetratricopeptide (TPR) repeat protein